MKKIHIALVEDNPGDILLVREALNFLARMGKPMEVRRPDILLLDLNPPRVDGHEVLREFRTHPKCATTPVIVVSSSDTVRNRELGVPRYFKKPTNIEAFMELGAMVKEVTQSMI